MATNLLSGSRQSDENQIGTVDNDPKEYRGEPDPRDVPEEREEDEERPR